MSTIDASIYDNILINSTATGTASLYQRSAVNVLNATLEDAVNIGTLATNKTHLNVVGQVSRANGTSFSKFTLDGDSIKLNITNLSGSATLRTQLINSSGKVIADSSSFATDELQEAYQNLASSDGLDAKAGDYFVKVTYDATESRSAAQSYSISLYSGTVFSSSYQTTAKSQVSTSQNVAVDNTLVYSTNDALLYGVDNVHLANETSSTGLDIGYLYENKSALSVTSEMTSTVTKEYYSFLLQKGDNLKMAFNNKTDTATLRVQVLDSSGHRVIADSEGTDSQKKAYAALTSSEGLESTAGKYIVKVSYAKGESTNKPQHYDFQIYSGNSYEKLYKTTAATETMETAISQGHISSYNTQNSLVTYLWAQQNGEDSNIMDVLGTLASTSGSSFEV